jgi:hypothetical protein
MKQKINNFKGIYTNEDEVSISPEYCKSTNAKITPVGLSAVGTFVNSVLFDANDKEILYADSITLDADPNSSRYNPETDKFENPYVYSPEYYFCIITSDNKLRLYTGSDGSEVVNTNTFSFEGTFKQAINYNGRFYFITDKGSYELGYYNRETNRLYSPKFWIRYEEKGLLLKPFTYQMGNYPLTEGIGDLEIKENKLGCKLQIKKIAGEQTIEHTSVRLRVVDKGSGGLIKIFGVPAIATAHTIGVYILDSHNNALDTIFFMTAPSFNQNQYDQLKGNAYYPLTKDFKLEFDFDEDLDEQMEVLGSEGATYWNERFGANVLEHSMSRVDNDSSKTSIFDLEDLEGLSFTELVTPDENNGFSALEYETYVMHSFLLDDGSEIPLEEIKLEDSTINASEYYFYKVDVIYPWNLTSKVTAHRVYVKHQKNDNYEMIYNYSFYSTDLPKRIITALDKSGIFSSQTIGVDNPFEYSLITSFEDFTLVNGVFIGVNRGIAYYPIIGNGRVTKLYWNINTIPHVTGHLISSISSSIGVISSDRVYLIDINSQDGFFVFTVKDEVGFVIKDQYDKAETPDGTIFHTTKGIYVTNGTELTLLSEPINNIVKENWKSSNIFYDTYSRELWYVNSALEKLYRFDFETNSWREDTYYNVVKIFTAIDGKKYLVSTEKIEEIEEKGKQCHYQSLLSNLNAMGYLKNITQIDFDFKGSLTWNENKIESESRTTKTIYKKLKSRVPKDYEDWYFVLEPNSVLYGIEINYEVNPKVNEYRS